MPSGCFVRRISSKGRPPQIHFSIKEIHHAGVNRVDRIVAVGGNLITSNEPDDLLILMRAAITAMINHD